MRSVIIPNRPQARFYAMQWEKFAVLQFVLHNLNPRGAARIRISQEQAMQEDVIFQLACKWFLYPIENCACWWNLKLTDILRYSRFALLHCSKPTFTLLKRRMKAGFGSRSKKFPRIWLTLRSNLMPDRGIEKLQLLHRKKSAQSEPEHPHFGNEDLLSEFYEKEGRCQHSQVTRNRQSPPTTLLPRRTISRWRYVTGRRPALDHSFFWAQPSVCVAGWRPESYTRPKYHKKKIYIYIW